MRYLIYFIASCFLFLSLPVMAQTKDEGVTSESSAKQGSDNKTSKKSKHKKKSQNSKTDRDVMPNFFGLSDNPREDSSNNNNQQNNEEISDNKDDQAGESSNNEKPNESSNNDSNANLNAEGMNSTFIFIAEPSATIYIDDKDYGGVKHGDRKTIQVKEGSHKIKMVCPGNIKKKKTLTIKKGGTAEIICDCSEKDLKTKLMDKMLNFFD